MADPSANAISAVRFYIGDPDDGAGTQLTDDEIQFALDQNNDDPFAAGATSARALAARYARRVDTDFETVGTKYSQLRDNYLSLARDLDKQARLYGKRGLGVPIAGGTRVSDMETARGDADRVKPFFRRGLFNNPPSPVSDADYDG